jgi:tripartite ATP-independent transporter DctP family solute receptor
MMAGLLGRTAAAGTYRLIFASYFGPSHPNTKAMESFKEKLEKASNGAFRITLKPNNEAGGEEKIMELVKRGTLQVALVGGLIKDDEPMIGGWEQPFIVDGWEHARKVFIGGEFADKFAGKYTEKTGVRIKGLVVNGFRQISCNFAITTMDDFRRMKIRTPLSDTFIQIFKGLGTNPTPMPMTELYTAMETKVVDGQDNPYSTVVSMGWWEVQPYMLESRHVFSPTSVLVNGKFEDGLPEDMRKLFNDTLAETISLAWDLAEKDEGESVKFLKDKNIVIHIPDNNFKQQMRDAMKDPYAWFDANVPGAKAIRDYCASKR